MTHTLTARQTLGGFIAQIKEARQAAGLTQAQMSARVGCSLPAYQSIELGRRTPSLAMFVSIVKTLNGAIQINLPTGKREPTPPEKESRPHQKKRPASPKNRK